jgi:hypothetical protein
MATPSKQGNPVNPAFDFWIENKVANKRTFFISDIRQLFQKWLTKQRKDWLIYYNSQAVVSSFIASKDGLNAVCDAKDFEQIRIMLKPDYLAAIK